MQYGHGHKVMPAIWFRFDISPITVKYTEKRRPIYHFLTTVSNVVFWLISTNLIQSCFVRRTSSSSLLTLVLASALASSSVYTSPSRVSKSYLILFYPIMFWQNPFLSYFLGNVLFYPMLWPFCL